MLVKGLPASSRPDGAHLISRCGWSQSCLLNHPDQLPHRWRPWIPPCYLQPLQLPPSLLQLSGGGGTPLFWPPLGITFILAIWKMEQWPMRTHGRFSEAFTWFLLKQLALCNWYFSKEITGKCGRKQSILEKKERQCEEAMREQVGTIICSTKT